MLEALAACHKHRVTHRDIVRAELFLRLCWTISNPLCARVLSRKQKPENFVFESPAAKSDSKTAADTKKESDAADVGRLKLIDFGCALQLNDSDVGKEVAGRPYYIAPEVLDDTMTRTGATWRASDMWSVGVIVFLLVCGYPPFYADRDSDIFKLIKQGVFVFPTDRRGEPLLSAPVRDFIVKLLVRDPRKRMTAVEALAHPWIAEKSAAPDTYVCLPFTLALTHCTHKC